MAHLFAGIPRQVEAYEVLSRHGGLGALEPDEDQDRTLDNEAAIARGGSLFDLIYGSNASSVRSRLYSFHDDFGTWVQRHAYGRVLSRPGLDAATRELCAVGALAALDQLRQLASHARGAEACGASRASIYGVLESISDLVDADRIARAKTVLDRFVSASS